MNLKQFYVGRTIGFVVVLVLVGAFFVVSTLQKSPTNPLTETTAPKVDPALLARLQADMQGITPHFLDRSDGGAQPLTPQEEKIKNDIIDILTIDEPDNREYYSRLLLRAIGTRSVLVSQPSADSYYDMVIDAQSGSQSFIINGASYAPHYLPLELQSTEGDRQIALYIGYEDLYTYTLDQASFVLIPGSKLMGNETYHSGRGDFSILPEETHTENSITISVFDSSQMVQNPDALSQPTAMQTMSKKVREMTLSF